jgi:putative sigma-54 modulation protein
MRIEVKGRNLPVTEELREVITRRFDKVAKQVSPLAVLEVELCEERNPAIADNQVAEATLFLKGVTLRAKESSRDVKHSVNLISDDLARQVKRHRDKRRGRRDARAGAGVAESLPADVAEGPGEAAAAY